MNYTESIAYLHSLTDYEKTRLARYSPDMLDLTRVRRLLGAMGNPHTRFLAVHVAGTKGKGSTSAIVESCLRAAGYRTGLYTSPHLHTFRERIQVDGEPISRDDVVALVAELRPVIERIPGVTTFEAITALGFVYFVRCGVDIAVVEVGLGGRLDATNVLVPEVSVITSISLDHTYLLGDTVAEIAVEKAGIIKQGVPVVSAPQSSAARSVIETVSRERGALLSEVGREWTYEPGPADLDGQRFTVACHLAGGSDLADDYWVPLLGRHQLENACTAIAALDALRARLDATAGARSGLAITAEAAHDGLRRVYWPGRMELLSREPLVVVDCAHNPYSTEVLLRALEEWFPGQRWTLIFGASSDKDSEGMLDVLLPLADYVIVTRSDHPRSAAPADLADLVASLNGDGSGAEISVNVKKALRRGLSILPPGGALLVTGSIFVVAGAREEWEEYAGRPSLDNDGP